MTIFGVNCWLRTGGGGMDAVWADSTRNLGIKEWRVPVPWVQIEPNRGQYNWWVADATCSLLASRGMRMQPILYRTPSWASISSDKSTAAPPDPAAYAKFVGDFAWRYGPWGTFWDTYPGIPQPIYQFEIWNEQDNHFLGDWKGTEVQYCDIYRAARAKLASLNRGLQAIVGGLAYDEDHGMGRVWLGRNWANLGKVDAVGWHPYGFGPDPAQDVVNKINGMIKFLNNRDSSAKIDVTECGLPVGLAGVGPRDGVSYSYSDRGAWFKEVIPKVKAISRCRRFNIYTWHNEAAFDLAEPGGQWLSGTAAYRNAIG